MRRGIVALTKLVDDLTMNENPDEVFLPSGVPYNPRSTQPFSPPQPSGPPPGTILFDETDALGIATVILRKTEELYIPLKEHPTSGLIVLEEFCLACLLA